MLSSNWLLFVRLNVSVSILQGWPNVLGILQDTELGSKESKRGRPMLMADMGQYMEHISGKASNGEFRCKLCGKISARKVDSFRHIESKHFPGQNEYNCDRCNKKFDTYEKLKTHRNRQCPPTSGSGFENKWHLKCDLRILNQMPKLNKWTAAVGSLGVCMARLVMIKLQSFSYASVKRQQDMLQTK